MRAGSSTLGALAGAFAMTLALAGCGATAASTVTAGGAARGGPAASAPAPGAPAVRLPGQHVHGIAAAKDGSRVLVATHEGVFDVMGGAPARLGEPDDVMGLAGDPSGTLWASGHPAPGSSKPNPLGLLRSVDGGRTWTGVSNEGMSDFHALAVTKSGLVGFDGALKRTASGRTWTEVPVPFHPAALAGHPSSDTVLATTELGPFASSDGGATWSAVPGAPVIQYAAFADAHRAIGIAPDGAVHTSADSGRTWTRAGTVSGGVEALAAAAPEGEAGVVRVWVATSAGLLTSTDGGATFG